MHRREFVAALYERRISYSSTVADRRGKKPHYFGISGHRARLVLVDGIDDLIKSGSNKILRVTGVEYFDSVGEQSSCQHGIMGPAKWKIFGPHIMDGLVPTFRLVSAMHNTQFISNR